MRLVSYRVDGREEYGAVVDGGVVPCASFRNGAAPTLRSVLEQQLLPHLGEFVAGRAPDFAIDDVELLPPIPTPSKIVCVGVNYLAHREEASQPRVQYPTLFSRFADSVVGHNSPVVKPGLTSKLDYEGEIALVIGQVASGVHVEAALDVVAGFTCFNDYSVRDWQNHTSQWLPGKNFFGVGSSGPSLVSMDEIPDPTLLTLETRVNGDLRQSAPSKDMIFSFSELIAYISSFTILLPGDLIVTGTPGGVGLFREPPEFLRAGDTVEVEIPFVGVLRNIISESD